MFGKRVVGGRGSAEPQLQVQVQTQCIGFMIYNQNVLHPSHIGFLSWSSLLISTRNDFFSTCVASIIATTNWYFSCLWMPMPMKCMFEFISSFRFSAYPAAYLVRGCRRRSTIRTRSPSGHRSHTAHALTSSRSNSQRHSRDVRLATVLFRFEYNLRQWLLLVGWLRSAVHRTSSVWGRRCSS